MEDGTGRDDAMSEKLQTYAHADSQQKTRQPLCGFLTIHSKTGLMKSYKSKWFVYSDESGKLLYYKSKGELRPEGEIPITHAIFTFDVKEKPGVFEIRTGDVVIALEARDREEMVTWLQELQTRRKDITKKRTSKSLMNQHSGAKDSDATCGAGDMDEHPHIILAEHSKADKSATAPAAISKLSHNMSKAADSAKQRLSAMFSRPSESTYCDDCLALQDELGQAREDTRLARAELESSQAVLKVLHDQTNLLTEEVATLNNVKQIYADPAVANQVDQEKEIQKLRYTMDELNRENEKLALENKSMSCEVSDLMEHRSMCTETILAKDNVIMALSDQLENAVHGSTPASSPIRDLTHVEPFHESVKDKLEAFELQNKVLNKEILELHFVRLEDHRTMEELNKKNIELEARYYQLHSKYLLVLNEINKPQLDEQGETKEPDELMGQLLDEAMHLSQESGPSVELRDTLNSSLRSNRKYDSYGFEIEGWSDDIMVQAAGFQSKSEQLVATMHESPEAVSLRVKWENFLAVISTQEIRRSVEFKNLIRAGIPKDHREKVWNILINFYVGKFKTTVGPGYYERLGKKHSRTKHNPMAKQIELDLRRTLPNNKYFEADDSDGIPKLRRILLAYSYHNPVIGYCQGMNRVAAFALLFLKEEDAFWCLVAIIDFIMPADYFSVSMVAAQADQRVLRDILVEKIPRVTAHLDALEMDISLFSFNWFLTLFIENIPVATVLRIWDAFLFEGIKILFRYATAFFKYSEDGILSCTDYISANQYLREIGRSMSNTERITYIAFNSINPFPIRMITTKRAAYLEQVKAELRELNALREEFKSQRAHLDYESESEEELIGDGKNGADSTADDS